MQPGPRRRLTPTIVLGACVLISFLGLGTLNAFNLKVLNPTSTALTFTFIALSVLAFLLFCAVLVLLVRNVLRLYQDQRSNVLGARLRTRMLVGAVLVSIVPLVFMFAFSFLLLNRSMDRWFSQPVSQLRTDANSMAHELFNYAATNARDEARSIAVDLDTSPAAPLFTADTPSPQLVTAAGVVLEHHAVTLQGGFVVLYRDGHVVTRINAPQNTLLQAQLKVLRSPNPAGDAVVRRHVNSPDTLEVTNIVGPADQTIFDAAHAGTTPFFSFNGRDYTLGTAQVGGAGLVITGLPVPAGISAMVQRLHESSDAYSLLEQQRRQVRLLYSALLALITVLALFACCWLALHLSRQVTRPVESLAEAMEAIAAGDYAHRVAASSTEEMGQLVSSFNAMAADLDTAHQEAAAATAQLSTANTQLEARRQELETILQTIPNGVATLSPLTFVVTANRAFAALAAKDGVSDSATMVGRALSSVIDPEIAQTLLPLMGRARRMGAANAEVEINTPRGPRQLALTVALLESGSGAARTHLGYVVVLEDATELLQGQRQMAWKEVARRVAHEIKNPLTPIQLNAERIARHNQRLANTLADRQTDSPSTAVIQHATEVITLSVETLRNLVDNFSSLAEFPAARPRPSDLNAIIERALALFSGRLEGITVHLALTQDLPLVLADPDGLQRALTNLIDNAAEAMQDGLLRELHIATGPLPSGLIELTVADTGPGVTDEIRERLFLPYVSTKQRGTGLGLSIAAKIIQEHHGTIRAEKNHPTGARFIIELQPASVGDSHANTAGDASVVG